MPQHQSQAARAARIAHHVPGRLRLKVLGAPAQREYFAAVKEVISRLEGVDSVRVNASSSSIVIDYSPADTVFHYRLNQDPTLNSWLRLEGEEALLARVDQAMTSGTHYLGLHSRMAEGILSGAEQLDNGLRRASDGYVDLKLLLPMAFALATSMRQARGRGTPMWLSLGTFAFNSFLTLHRERKDAPVVKIMADKAVR